MGSIPENRKHWGETYAWSAGGEEWSESWGGSAAQWRFTLAPRLARFLPASRIVEIGCGHGRWTHYLRERCDEVIALDLVDSCVAACRERFGDDPRVVCRSTDGLSLTGVEDASVDLVFSFDSLVHAELDTLERYLVEMARCLRPGGPPSCTIRTSARSWRFDPGAGTTTGAPRASAPSSSPSAAKRSVCAA